MADDSRMEHMLVDWVDDGGLGRVRLWFMNFSQSMQGTKGKTLPLVTEAAFACDSCWYADAQGLGGIPTKARFLAE